MKYPSVLIQFAFVGGFFWFGVAGCAPERPSDVEANLLRSQPGVAQERPAEERAASAQAVAIIDQEILTLHEFERRLSTLAEFAQARYATTESKQEYLVDVVQFEVLADEAERRGYGTDPLVLQAMKEVLARKVLQDELRERVQVRELDENALESTQIVENGEQAEPEERRMVVLTTDTEAEAAELRARFEDRAYGSVAERVQSFRILAHRYSTDRVSAERGGDVGFVLADDEARRVLREQAFRLEEVGALSQPYEVEDGWQLAMILEKRAAAPAALSQSDAQAQARRQLFEQERERARVEFVEGLMRSADVEIFEDRLAELPLLPRRDMSTGTDSNSTDQK